MRGLVLATLLAGLGIALAGSPAWGHTFPPVRTVVLQVERDEVVLLVGYRPGSGEPTQALLARAASQPKSLALKTLRSRMATDAMAPLALVLDGVTLVPTSVRSKLGTEPSGVRPMVIVLVTYRVPRGTELAVTSRDPRTTRISWADRDSGRVAISEAPTQGKWFSGVASFLLQLRSCEPDCS
ncbi:MAG: hypothetical protein WKG01_07165 [Kofleriaceae bacterium]